MTSTVSAPIDKDYIRSVIARKKRQVELFKEDLTRPKEDKSFTDAEYNKKIADLEKDIADLEASLG